MFNLKDSSSKLLTNGGQTNISIGTTLLVEWECYSTKQRILSLLIPNLVGTTSWNAWHVIISIATSLVIEW